MRGAARGEPSADFAGLAALAAGERPAVLARLASHLFEPGPGGPAFEGLSFLTAPGEAAEARVPQTLAQLRAAGVAEEAVILANLKEARERAIDSKNMKQISAIFEIYKTRNEQFLNNNGRNWKALYSAYVKAAQARKAAENKP